MNDNNGTYGPGDAFFDYDASDPFADILKQYNPDISFTDDIGYDHVNPKDDPTGGTGGFDWKRLWQGIQNLSGKALTGGTPQNAGMLALLGALAGYMDKRAPSGGGVARAYTSPQNIPQRQVVQGKYGPIAKYAAQGGLMSAYARGGEIAMEDGGFVMTKRAVDGAGGIAGLQQRVPEAQPIRGPGTGTSDSIPARIHGQDGTVAPARVSNGEAYVPPGRDTKALYALMRALEQKA